MLLATGFEWRRSMLLLFESAWQHPRQHALFIVAGGMVLITMAVALVGRTLFWGSGGESNPFGTADSLLLGDQTAAEADPSAVFVLKVVISRLH